MKADLNGQAHEAGRTGLFQGDVCLKRRRPAEAAVCLLLVLAAAATGVLRVAGSSVEALCPLIDFEGNYCSVHTSDLKVGPILGYAAFYDNAGKTSFAAVSCVTDLKEPQTHSRVARVEYDVSRLRSYAGFWLKWEVPGFSIGEWDAIVFDIRGCDASIQNDRYGKYEGFTSRVKVELKIAGWGWRVAYFDFVTADWQTVRIPVADFIDTGWSMEPNNEFVTTFEEQEATADRGIVYIDNIRFERSGDG